MRRRAPKATIDPDPSKTWLRRAWPLVRAHRALLITSLGPTGAGKSTLAKLVTRRYDPSAGRILIDGHDLRDVTLESLRRQIGVVPQEPFLFAGTLRDNIAFADPSVTDAQVWAAIDAVGLRDLVRRSPAGLSMVLHERGNSVSSGERQLIALARAFLAAPRVVVLDEATSSLDLRTELRVESALDRLLDGRTAILVAHRLSTARRADRIIVVADGGIVEAGPHEELVAAGGIYASMYATWTAHSGPKSWPSARSTPHAVAITFGGPLVHRIAYCGADQRVKLLFARDGQRVPTLPSADDWCGSYRALPDDVRPFMRTYTVRSQDPHSGRIDIEFILHGDGGPASAWASADASARVFVQVPTADDVRHLDTACRDVRITWLTDTDPAEAIRTAKLPAGVPYAWVAGEAAMVRSVRRHLVGERGYEARTHYFGGYWRAGVAEDAQ